MEITDKGQGLHILVTTNSTAHNEWLSFCSWYSICKNLPEAEVVVACSRCGENSAPLGFLWPYRTSTRYFQHKNLGSQNPALAACIALERGLIRQPFIIMDDKTVAIRKFSQKLIEKMASCDFINNGSVRYFNNRSIEMLVESINTNEDCEKAENELSQECGEQLKSLPTFSQINSQCARFNLEDWIKRYNVPPFAYSKRFKSIDMTVSQNKVLDLWKRIANLYEAIR